MSGTVTEAMALLLSDALTLVLLGVLDKNKTERLVIIIREATIYIYIYI